MLELRDRDSVTYLLLFIKVTVIDVVCVIGHEWLWAEAFEHLGHLTFMLDAKLFLFCLSPVASYSLDLGNFVLAAFCETYIVGHLL